MPECCHVRVVEFAGFGGVHSWKTRPEVRHDQASPVVVGGVHRPGAGRRASAGVSGLDHRGHQPPDRARAAIQSSGRAAGRCAGGGLGLPARLFLVRRWLWPAAWLGAGAQSVDLSGWPRLRSQRQQRCRAGVSGPPARLGDTTTAGRLAAAGRRRRLGATAATLGERFGRFDQRSAHRARRSGLDRQRSADRATAGDQSGAAARDNRPADAADRDA